MLDLTGTRDSPRGFPHSTVTHALPPVHVINTRFLPATCKINVHG